MTSSTEGRRSSSSAPRGTSNGTLASRSVRFARTSRCAIVDSEARKAMAISVVVSPPSSRRVSATRASRESSGWQQVKISASRSSPISSSAAASKSERSIANSAPVSWATSSRLRSYVFSRRIRSIARFFAVAISQAPGLSGTPASGHFSIAATSASCAMSSARPTSPTIRARPAIRRADSIRQTASIARVASVTGTASGALVGVLHLLREVLHLEDPADLDPAVAVGAAACPLQRLLLRPRLDQPVAADDLLCLGEGPVGDRRLALAVEADAAAVARRAQAVEREQHPGLLQLLVVAAHRRHGLGGRVPVRLLELRVHQHHETHPVLLRRGRRTRPFT